MFCLSCGKKITEKGKFCKYCGANQTELELDKKKKENFHNSKIPFYRNKTQRAWFFLWVTTLFVFAVSLFIFSKFDEYSINLFNGDFLMVLFLSNIFIGIISFLAMIITSIKKHNRVSLFTKKIFIICLFYLLLSPAIFATEGYKAKNDEGYKNKYYVEITPTITPTPTIEIKVTPTVIPKKTVKPVQKAVETDPIIDCVSSYPNCNGSSIKLRRSQCSNITCCQIGNNWSVYPSSEKCKEAQNNNSNNYVRPTSAPIPTYKPLPTYAPIPTSSYVAPTIYIYQTPTPNQSAIDAEIDARISRCKGDCIRSVDSYITSVRNSCRASGGWSSYCQNAVDSRDALISQCQSNCY